MPGIDILEIIYGGRGGVEKPKKLHQKRELSKKRDAAVFRVPVGLLKKSRRRKKRGTGKVLLSQNAPSPGVFPHFCSFAVLGNNVKKANNEFSTAPL